MPTNKFIPCKDCRWFSSWGDDGVTCTNVLYRKFDPVDGWQPQQARHVRTTEELCGEAGKGWEPRRPAPPRWMDHVGMGVLVVLILAWLWVTVSR
jgi:hypothetical protein